MLKAISLLALSILLSSCNLTKEDWIKAMEDGLNSSSNGCSTGPNVFGGTVSYCTIDGDDFEFHGE